MTNRILPLVAVFALAASAATADESSQPPGKKQVAALRQQLASPDAKKQLQAARDLERLGPLAAEAVSDLVAALKTRNPKLRLTVLQALSAIGPDAVKAVPRLREIVRDKKESEQIRANAVEALGSIGRAASDALPELAALLREEGEDVLVSALLAVGTIEEPARAVELLRPALADKYVVARMAAAKALGRLGPRAYKAAANLIGLLKESKVSAAILILVKALGYIGPAARDAVPQLRQLLHHQEVIVQLHTIEALGRMAPLPEETVILDLGDLLQHDDVEVQKAAALALGRLGPDAARIAGRLVPLLRHRERQLRETAARALGRIRPAEPTAVPELMKLFQDEEVEIREAAAEALALIEDTALDPLRSALDNGDPLMRRGAAFTLGKIGRPARAAAGPLLALLRPDEYPEIRLTSMTALGEIEPRDEGVILKLWALVRDGERPAERLAAATALGKIVEALGEREFDLIPALVQIKEEFRQGTAPAEDVPVLRKAVAGKLEKLTHTKQEEEKWRPTPWELLAIVLLVLFVALHALWWGLYACRPLGLLSLNDWVQHSDLRLSESLGGKRLPWLRLLLGGLHWFHYRPRVLDAWVGAQVPTAQQRFPAVADELVADRDMWVPVPFTGRGGELDPVLRPSQLSDLFNAGRTCILIHSPDAETGKTGFVCQLGASALHLAGSEPLAVHPVLPVLLHPLSPALESNDFALVLRRRLLDLIGPGVRLGEQLFAELLRQKRVLVILDGFSEMPPAFRALVHPQEKHFPVRALVLTSRRKEPLEGAPLTALTPAPLTEAALQEFLSEYLRRRQKAALLDDDDLNRARRWLEHVCAARPITPLLAKLYAEALIDCRLAVPPQAPPDNLPDLILACFELWTGRGRPELLRDAMRLAWACLEGRFRPEAVPRAEALAALAAAGGQEGEPRLRQLEAHARLLNCPALGSPHLRFRHSLLAEYLAAGHLVERLGNRREQWLKFFARVVAQQGEPGALRTFLLAVLDSGVIHRARPSVPDAVLQELVELTTLEKELTRQVRTEMDEARRHRDSLFPAGDMLHLPAAEVAHRRRQAALFSGDIYGFIEDRPDGCLGIYAIDVKGHGTVAHLPARSLYQALTSHPGWGHGNPHAELQQADQLVGAGRIFLKENASFCMNFTKIDAHGGEIRYANAGMHLNACLHFPANGAAAQRLDARGMYVGGGYAKWPVQPAEAVVNCAAGDLLVLVSDGILEARDEKGELFQKQGIEATVRQLLYQDAGISADAIADELLRAVARYARKAIPDDDQTVIVVKFHPPKLAPAAPVAREDGERMLRIVNDRDAARHCHQEVQPQLDAYAREHGFTESRRREQIWTAVWEALQNAVRHGSERGEDVQLRLLPLDEQGRLGVELTQPRPWPGWDREFGAQRRRELEGGRFLLGGTVIVLDLADQVQWLDQGRRLVLRFARPLKPERKVKLPAAVS